MLEQQSTRRGKRRRSGRAHDPAMPPGSLVTRGPRQPAAITLRRYDGDHFDEQTPARLEQLERRAGQCLWLDVAGMRDPAAVEAVGRALGLHPLPLEDVLDPHQRPKVEEYDGLLFVVLETLTMDEALRQSRIAMFLGRGFVVTFHEPDDSCLEPVRERLRQGRGHIRSHGADYLAYTIIDSIVDHYYPAMERFDDHLEAVEDAVLDTRTDNPIGLARGARADLQRIRHAIWPAREVLAYLVRQDSDLLADETRVYLRDCYDHVEQLQEMVEASREIAASLLEVYISSVSLATNRAMRLLAVIATIFIPITFLTGLWGMNFAPTTSPLNMPELRWYWGYPFAIGVMTAMTLGLLVYFWRRGWLARR